jgi:20S proteasome alpha/beta subunit
MQVAIARPDLGVIVDRRKPVKRNMTYQVIFCGVDGVVIASDRLESEHQKDGTVAPGNQRTKISLAGEFAWAFSGGDLARIFSTHLERALKDKADIEDHTLLDIVECCRRPAFSDWHDTASGASGPANKIILVRGSNQHIFQIDPLPGRDTQNREGRVVAGQMTNFASFLFHRLHSTTMSVKALVNLAAYSVRAANLFDSSCIDGLDVATYEGAEGFMFRSMQGFSLISVEDELRSVFQR